MPTALPTYLGLTPRRLYAHVLVFVVNFLTASAAMYVYYAYDTSPALIWPPVGIALAAVILGGYSMWVPIFLAQFLAVILRTPDLTYTHIVFAIAVAYALQALIGLYVMRRLSFTPKLDVLSNALILVFAALVITMIEPTIATAWQYFSNTLAVSPILNWGRAWAAGIFSVLVVTPFIITWYPWRRTTYTQAQIFEIAAAFTLLTANNIFVFWTSYTQYVGISIIFFLPAVLLWFALRFEVRWLTLAVLHTAVVGIVGSIVANPSAAPLSVQLLSVEIYIGLIAAIFFVFTAVVEERRAAYKSIALNNVELQTLLEKISREDQAKSEFLAILAHELRNPLAPVVSSLELMKIKMKDEKREDMLELIELATVHNTTITLLLDDILDISRVSRNKFELRKEVVSLAPLVHAATQTAGPLYTSKNHTITVSLPTEPVSLEVDRLRFQQIIVNLLFNAGKYTPQGGHIHISAILDPERGLRLAVKDNGIGIPFGMLRRIFDPFIQVAKSNERYGGTGLGVGLALTKHLVELHGGEIWAESEGEGKGSEFVVVFPSIVIPALRHAQPRLPQAEPAVHSRSSKKSRNILVIDDNADAAMGLKRLLEHGGHQVRVAHDGETGLTHMKERSAEVVLLDLGLPSMSGYDVAHELRKRYGSNPLIVALTGYGQEDDKRRTEAAGFNFHLTKPVGIAEIEVILS